MKSYNNNTLEYATAEELAYSLVELAWSRCPPTEFPPDENMQRLIARRAASQAALLAREIENYDL